jgi:AGZA family xanthine/uracil permease-like MFS transporter
MQTIQRFFQLNKAGSSIHQELHAGFTSFLTMAYILVVNPAILSQTGMDPHSVFLATCFTSALGCILIGLLSNYPIGIAPGMAMNAYFAYQINHNLGIAWPEAMGLIFISGLLFFIICITPIKTWILNAIPNSLNLAISSGIGVFIGFIALKEMGLIIVTDSGFLQMGSLYSIPTLIALLGFISIIIMESYKIPGAIIISIVLATLLNLILTHNTLTDNIINYELNNTTTSSFFSTFGGLSFNAISLDHRSFSIILTFLFVVLFDSTGTLIAVMSNQNKTQESYASNKKTSNALLANSITAITGSVFGTTPTSPYIESAAGIKAGGRTGLTAITIGICFLLAIAISPLTKLVPIYATAPALLYVACLMIEHLADIKWQKLTEAIPAALTLMLIPFTFSIADGIGFGILSYSILNLLCKRNPNSQHKSSTQQTIHPMLWALSVIFIIYFLTK